MCLVLGGRPCVTRLRLGQPLLLLPVFLEFRVIVHLLGDRERGVPLHAIDGGEDILRIQEVAVCQVILELALSVKADREAGVLTGVGCFQESEQAPGGDHAGPARRQEREGDAGQRQDVDGTEYVQHRLEDEQGRGRAGGYAVIGGASGCDRAEREYGQCDDAQDGQDGNDEAPFLREHAEDKVCSGTEEVAQIAFTSAESRQASAGGGGHGLYLLISAFSSIVPGMSPCLEPAGHIGTEPEDHQAHQTGGPEDEDQLGEIAGAQEGDDEERDEEDDRRSEVTHQSQTAQAEDTEAHEQIEAPFLLQLVQRRCTDIDKYDLDQLGWLEGISPDVDPVLRTVRDRAEEHVDEQQESADAKQQVGDFFRTVQIPQIPAEEEEHSHTQHDTDRLLQDPVRSIGIGQGYGQAQGR